MFNQNKKISFYTLGCKLNFAETSTIARNITKNGYSQVEFGEYADITVINTCSVTENAEKKCKEIIHKILKMNYKTYIIIIGCYAQLNPKKIAKLPGVDLILGAKEKFNLINHINSLEKNITPNIQTSNINEADFYIPSYSIHNRTRSFLKIQDGCNYKCTYCTIPLTRGISRSDSLQNILNNAKKISNQGIKEIVLTGINIGDYRNKNAINKKINHQYNLLNLINKLDKINEIKRIRISSIEPNLLHSNIINQIAKSKKFVPHFHIPLQSGSDIILKQMKRRYLTNLYSNKITQIKTLLPDACIGADVIVGYPGETEELFLETYQYINSLNISYLHVFTYSERNNTEAVFKINNNKIIAIPIEIRKKRRKMLQILSEKKRYNFYLSQMGKSKTVLWEKQNKNGMMFGFTENYIRIQTTFNYKKINLLEKITLNNLTKEGYYII